MSKSPSPATSPCPLAKTESDLDSGDELENVAVNGAASVEAAAVKDAAAAEQFVDAVSSLSSEGGQDVIASGSESCKDVVEMAETPSAIVEESSNPSVEPHVAAAAATPASGVAGSAAAASSTAAPEEVVMEMDRVSIDDLSVSSISGNNHRQNSTTSRSSNCSYGSSGAAHPASSTPAPGGSSATTLGPAPLAHSSTTPLAATLPSLSASLTSFKSLTFPREVTLNTPAELALHHPVVPSPSSLSCIIHLNVGGHPFSTSLSTLIKYEDSMLAAMFSGRHAFSKDREGRYFIDRDGQFFGHVLSYLRSDALPPEDVVLQVLREAEFFCLQSMIEKLEATSPRVIAVRRREYFRALIPDYESIKKSVIGVASQKRTAFEESIVVLTQDNHAKLQGSIPCYNCTREPVCVTHDCTFQGNKSDITIKVKTQEINMDKMIGFIVNELVHDGFAVSSNVVVCKFSLRCHSCTMSGLYTAGGILAPRECPNMAHVLTFGW